MQDMRKQPCGFTLVEILVTIGIVVVIAAILLPVLARARDRARTTTCAGNLRQIGLALNMYVKDHNNTHPPSGDPTDNCSWVDVVFPYAKSEKIFECPSALHGKYVPGCKEPEEGDGYTEYFNGSYVLNLFRNNPTNPIRTYRIHNPADAIWVSEGANRFGFEYVPDTYNLNTASIQTKSFQFRHNRGANNLFVDGHVKWLSLDAMTKKELWAWTP